MSDVLVATGHGQMPVHVAVPDGPGPWPGVVLVHDFTGMSHDLRSQADWLAGAGFLAVAPDLFHWGSRVRCLRTIMRDLGERRGRTFEDIDAARRWLVAHEGCSGRVGVIGFCMGGGYALALAPEPGYDAASVNYGGCPADAGSWLPEACPIVGSFGGGLSGAISGAMNRSAAQIAAVSTPRPARRWTGVKAKPAMPVDPGKQIEVYRGVKSDQVKVGEYGR